MPVRKEGTFPVHTKPDQELANDFLMNPVNESSNQMANPCDKIMYYHPSHCSTSAAVEIII